VNIQNKSSFYLKLNELLIIISPLLRKQGGKVIKNSTKGSHSPRYSFCEILIKLELGIVFDKLQSTEYGEV
jgi:hypothetical protein